MWKNEVSSKIFLKIYYFCRIYIDKRIGRVYIILKQSKQRSVFC